MIFELGLTVHGRLAFYLYGGLRRVASAVRERVSLRQDYKASVRVAG